MFILGKTWSDGYLDPPRSADELRIQVHAWQPLERLADVYLAQPRSVRRLWNYLREVGPRELLLKVRSRLAESLRDRKFISIGLGQVLERDAAASGPPPGTAVVFLAPWHPECMERVCLPPALLRAVDEELARRWRRAGALLLSRAALADGAPDWSSLGGWSRFSGIALDASAAALLDWARAHFSSADPVVAQALPLPQSSPIQERSSPNSPAATASGAPRGAPRQLRAVLFGLGNYAKTCIIPKLDPLIQLTCVHEIDTTQIGLNRLPGVAYDTSELLRPDESYDVYFIAGYHHTHADMAVHALRSGAWAVVEKPIVTTPAQLDCLLEALQAHPGKFFAGFNKRYDPLWRFARQDLALRPGQPVNYQCIVFEVPLVKRHWYNWPNSCSRIVSNGTHWLDHFLYMNDFAAPLRQRLWRARNGDMHVSVELENGAAFSMALTDHGSARLGLQDTIQLRAGDVTVTVQNASRYQSEDRFRIIRKLRLNRLTAFRRMYETISRKIVAGESGDTLESVRRSSELMLSLEADVQRATGDCSHDAGDPRRKGQM